MPALEEAVVIRKTFECTSPVYDFWLHPTGTLAVVDTISKLQVFDCYSLGFVDEFEKLRVWKQRGEHCVIFSESLSHFYVSDNNCLYIAELCKSYPSKLEEVRKLGFSRKSFVIEEYRMIIRCSKNNIQLLSFDKDTCFNVFQESPGRDYADFHLLFRSSAPASKRILLIEGSELSIITVAPGLDIRQNARVKEDRLELIVHSALSPDEAFLALQDKSNSIMIYRLQPGIEFFKLIKAEDTLLSLTMGVFVLQLFEEPQACLCFLQDKALVIKSQQFQVRRIRKLLDPVNRIFYSRVLDDMLLMLGQDGVLSALWLRVAPEWSRLSFRLVPVDKVVLHEQKENEFEDDLRGKEGSLTGLINYSDCIWAQEGRREGAGGLIPYRG